MCGISAIFCAREPLSAGLILSMTRQVRHRGPDGEGIVLFDQAGHPVPLATEDTPQGVLHAPHAFAPSARLQDLDTHFHVAFGHRRLAIVDLSPGGHQPMATEDRRLWITYNGEIYNHIELRAELEASGRRFATGSDTEVILQAYRQWGRDCLHRFNGMFAFVIHDTGRRCVFAARDRFGVKPIYYWRSPGGFLAFASEIKQFTVLPGWKARANGQRCADFLRWSVFDHSNETMFDGVFQLRGGECIECPLDDLQRGAFAAARWYDAVPRPFAGDMREAAATFRELFFDSVRLRLRADVPVGSCLSGGLDSSSIVCVANRILGESGATDLQKTFSARAEVARFDESRFIDEVVRHTAVDAHYTTPSLEHLDEIRQRLAWHHDEPFGSTSIFAQWCVFELAHQNGLKVMLDGQGSDELLAGYHGFLATRIEGLIRRADWRGLRREMRAQQAMYGRLPTPLWRLMLRRAGLRRHAFGLRSAVRNAIMDLPNSMPGTWALIRRSGIRRYLGGVRRAVLKVPDPLPTVFDLSRLGARDENPIALCGVQQHDIQSVTRYQVLQTNLPMLLHWEDRNSMAHSIEARVPFLDYRLVEFALGLPEEYKLSDAITKRVLREAMSGVIPDVIRDRKDKLGFSTPEEVWVRERAADQFRKRFDRAADLLGLLTPYGRTEIHRLIDGQRPFSYDLWRVLSFADWTEQYGVELPRGAP